VPARAITPFLRAGVPAFIFEQKGRVDYARTHHTAHDTVDALDVEAIQHSARAIALAALGIADLPQRLARANLVAAAPVPAGASLSCTTTCTPSCAPSHD